MVIYDEERLVIIKGVDDEADEFHVDLKDLGNETSVDPNELVAFVNA